MSLSKDDLIKKIQEIAHKNGQDFLSSKEFLSKAGISMKQVLRHFDRWNDAILEAGLSPLDKNGRPDQVKGYTSNELVEKVKELARTLSRNYLSLEEFTNHTGISYRPIYRHFGDWVSFLKVAGLDPHPNQKHKIEDEALFNDYFRVFNIIGHLPVYNELAKNAQYSIGVFEKRFGTFSKFRRQAIMWGVEQNLITPDIASFKDEQDLPRDTHSNSIYKELDDRPVLGEAIEFRGLQHAPVNEMGVVFLFGMIAEELGFVVESVQAGFPDCEAKRKLKKDRWQRVRIEFEFRSSNFIQHKHDSSGCDLIICWEHDWRDCPLEVICLQDFIKKK